MNAHLFYLYNALILLTIAGLFAWFAKRNPGYFEAGEDEDEERAKRMEKMLEETRMLVGETRQMYQEWQQHQKRSGS